MFFVKLLQQQQETNEFLSRHCVVKPFYDFWIFLGTKAQAPCRSLKVRTPSQPLLTQNSAALSYPWWTSDSFITLVSAASLQGLGLVPAKPCPGDSGFHVACISLKWPSISGLPPLAFLTLPSPSLSYYFACNLPYSITFVSTIVDLFIILKNIEQRRYPNTKQVLGIHWLLMFKWLMEYRCDSDFLLSPW